MAYTKRHNLVDDIKAGMFGPMPVAAAQERKPLNDDEILSMAAYRAAQGSMTLAQRRDYKIREHERQETAKPTEAIAKAKESVRKNAPDLSDMDDRQLEAFQEAIFAAQAEREVDSFYDLSSQEREAVVPDDEPWGEYEEALEEDDWETEDES